MEPIAAVHATRSLVPISAGQGGNYLHSRSTRDCRTRRYEQITRRITKTENARARITGGRVDDSVAEAFNDNFVTARNLAIAPNTASKSRRARKAELKRQQGMRQSAFFYAGQ